MGKANFQKTPLDITRKNVLTDKVLFGVSRQNNSNVTSVGSPSGGGQGSSIAPATGFLKTSGGSMIGPIAYYGATAVISGSSIDVSSTGAYSSLVYLSTSSDTNLDTIVGASNAGQRLTLFLSGGTHKVTIRDSTISGSNIQTLPQTTSYVMNPKDKVELFFDGGLNKWNVILPNYENVYANTTLSNLINPTTVNQSLIPLTNNNLNLGKLTSIWDVLYINDVHFTDTTDPNGKFTDIAYNPSTHDLEYSQTISGITAGQVFIYNTNKILGITGDNTYGDVGYVEFHQIHAYTTASAGTAPPLPSNPFGYIIIKRNGSQYKIPIYGI